MTDEMTWVMHELARNLVELERTTPDGGLLRIDHLSLPQAREMVHHAIEIGEDDGNPVTAVWIVVAEPENGQTREISFERAVELRNRSREKLLLLVPGGLAVAQSSIDNPFAKMTFTQLIEETNHRLLKELHRDSDLKSALVRLEPWWVRDRLNPLEVTRFLVAIHPNRSVSWSEHLWILGLIPDRGENPLERLEANKRASREISRPATQNAPLGSRLLKANLVDPVARARVERALSDSRLYSSQEWTKRLLDEDGGSLTFDRWPISTAADVELFGFELKPFVNRSGAPEKWSRLKGSGDDLLTLPMTASDDDESSGLLGIQWVTQPTVPVGVASFRVEIVPSAMARELGVPDEPVAEATVGKAKKSHVLGLRLSSEHAQLGDRFVVRVSALDESGQVITLKTSTADGDAAGLARRESEEFRVEVTAFEPEAYERKPTARSVTAARLAANLDGIDQVSPESMAWDSDNQLVSVKFAPGKTYSIQYSGILREMERAAMGAPGQLTNFVFTSNGQRKIRMEDLDVTAVDAPKGLSGSRKTLLKTLGLDWSKSALMVADWNPEVRGAALAYLASYRRALEASEGESLRALLTMDSLSIEMETGLGPIHAVVLLPSHPLRLGWVAKYEELMQEWTKLLSEHSAKARQSVLDKSLADRLAPVNFPYVSLNVAGEPFVYHSELTFASALYVPIGAEDVESITSSVLFALDLPRRPSSDISVDTLLERKIDEYRDVHPLLTGLSISAVNPGDGAVLASSLREALPETRRTEETLPPYPIRVSCFVERVSPTDPVPRLQALQREYRSLAFAHAPSYLVPPFSLSCVDLNRLESMLPSNLGLIQGLSGSGVTGIEAPDRRPLLRGLISPLTMTRSVEPGEGSRLAVAAALQAGTGATHDELPQCHLGHQTAVAKDLGLDGSIPGFAMSVSERMIDAITELHRKSDWVVTIDRNAGATTFEELIRPHLPDSVLLDYAPEFVDGFSDRISVTTIHRGEIDLALVHAMEELGLSTIGRGPTDIVKSLTDISGRLVLRLYQANTLAREAVGLAAVMTHLEREGSLSDTLIIPVDAHPEIFDPSKRFSGSPALRCDLILVRLTRRSFKLELVEVKARKSMKGPDSALNIKIENQLTETRSFLSSTVFPIEAGRVDSELQWVRAISLLHFYAERAAFAGRVEKERLGEMHSMISRLGENPMAPQFSLSGYVVTLDAGGSPQVVKRGDAKIRYLTAGDLEELGFSTRFDSDAFVEHSSTESRENS